MKRRVLTIHTEGLTCLSPQLVEILRVISEQFKNPEVKQTRTGLAVYVETSSYWRDGRLA